MNSWSLPTIETKEEIVANLQILESYRISAIPDENEFYRKRMSQGKCFVVCDTRSGERLFGPSRFVGYLDNNRRRHEANDDKHGGITNASIRNTLGFTEENDTALDAEHLALCTSVGVARTNYSAGRRYWHIRE